MSLVCPLCESTNRSEARFCWNCAAPLTQARTPLAPYRPSPEDARWLETELAFADEVQHPNARSTPSASLVSLAAGTPAKEKTMDEATPQVAPLFAGRYEVRAIETAAEPGTLPQRVEVLDHEPWRRCWACGSTNNEPDANSDSLFCNDCGAKLSGKRYRGQLSASDAPSGPALIADVQDAAARETLPEVWEQVSDAGKTLTVLRDSGRPVLTPPLDELTALRVAMGLARLQAALHTNGLVLGDLGPGDVEVGAAGAPHLRDVPNLQRMPAGEDALRTATNADLKSLAALIEASTSTPRTTQRLEQVEVDKIVSNPGAEPVLGKLLRDLRTGAIDNPQGLADTLQQLYDDRTKPVALRPRIGAVSNTGRVRDHNEDSLLTLNLTMNNTSISRTWGVYIVADGMGGHAAGEVASGLAIRGAAEVLLSEYVAPTLDLDSDFDEEAAKEIVRRAILQGNDYVRREAQARGNDMGTTFTMALVLGNRAIIGNVGDSRTYLFRDGELRRISNDHSLVMRLVELGQIAEEDIYTHPQRNAILRSLGDKKLEVDIFTQRLKPGDALFLCSDGQWEMTHNPQMTELLRQIEDPQQACEALIEAANVAGGEDNITAVLVKFEATE